MINPEQTNAVIWDMDGTLIDQTAGIIRCFAKVITDLGHPTPDSQEIRRSLGGTMVATMSLFVPPTQLESACLKFRSEFPSFMYDGLIILPGAQALIRYFHSIGIPQAILTNKHGPTARDISKYCSFDDIISVCIGHSDTAFSKPDSKLTHHLLERMGLAEEKNIICIGDSPTDVATARHAGFLCHAVATGAHTTEELLEAGASSAVESLTEWLPA